MAENTRGRPAGSRNRLTQETLALLGEGESPVAYLLGIMRDDAKPQDIRLNAAKIVAPYLHPRPQPEPRFVSFELPESTHSPDGLNQIHLGVLKAIAAGELSLDEGKDISLLVENQRRILETTDIVARLAKLEAAQTR